MHCMAVNVDIKRLRMNCLEHDDSTPTQALAERGLGAFGSPQARGPWSGKSLSPSRSMRTGKETAGK